MSKLTDSGLIVTTTKRSSGGWLCHVDTVAGKCFDDGTHGRSLEIYNGKKSDLLRDMAALIARDSVVECDDPDCDTCN